MKAEEHKKLFGYSKTMVNLMIKYNVTIPEDYRKIRNRLKKEYKLALAERRRARKISKIKISTQPKKGNKK